MTELHEFKAAVLDLQVGENPNEYIIRATKVGAYINASKGFQARWTEDALKATAPTWKGGVVSINHDGSNKGSIVDSWMDGEFCYQRVVVDDEKLKAAIDHDRSKVGVSVECDQGQVDDKFDIVAARGTGVTFVFAPYEPVCSQEQGCGLAGANTAKHSMTGDPPADIQGDNMPNDETVPKADFLTLQAANTALQAQFDALKTENVELLAFKTQVVEEKKAAKLEQLKARIGDEGAAKYKDETLCTIEKLLAATEIAVENAKITFSGASGKKKDDEVPAELVKANEVLKAAGLPILE
jgi:hypothetical protein